MGTPLPRVRAGKYSTIVGAVNPLPVPLLAPLPLISFALAFFPLEGDPLLLAGVGAQPIMRLETVYWRASFGRVGFEVVPWFACTLVFVLFCARKRKEKSAQTQRA
jgi:hypothetical protein